MDDVQKPYDPFEDIEVDLSSPRMWKIALGAATFIALIGIMGHFVAACATPGPLQPLPPVPDISGPPLMARADGGVRG